MGLSRTSGLVIALVAAGLGLAWYTASVGPWQKRGPSASDGLDNSKNLTRIVVGSSADQRTPTPAWASIAKEKPDLVVLTGDSVYGSETGNDPEMKELAAAYQLLSRDAGFKALRKSAPILSIWNDRDYGSNDSGGDFPYKARSKQLFLEFWGISPDAPRARREGLYDSYILGPAGQRVQVILLDARWFRDSLKLTDNPGAPGRQRYVADLDPKHTILGEQQWTWLEQELKKPAELRLIVSSIQVIAEGHGYEKWANFPTERQRLFDLIGATKAKGVIFLSGDRHMGAIYRRVDGVPYPFFELTSSALNNAVRAAAPEEDPERLGPLFTSENYGVISIDWERQAVTLALKGLNGKTVRLASVAIPVLFPSDTGAQSVFWTGQPPPLPSEDATSSVSPSVSENTLIAPADGSILGDAMPPETVLTPGEDVVPVPTTVTPATLEQAPAP